MLGMTFIRCLDKNGLRPLFLQSAGKLGIVLDSNIREAQLARCFHQVVADDPTRIEFSQLR